jgi:hypothetical protein
MLCPKFARTVDIRSITYVDDHNNTSFLLIVNKFDGRSGANMGIKSQPTGFMQYG